MVGDANGGPATWSVDLDLDGVADETADVHFSCSDTAEPYPVTGLDYQPVTAFADGTYRGQAQLTPTTWTGSEVLTVVGRTSGLTECEVGWDTAGVPTTLPVPCQDPDGGSCMFAFDVAATNGLETATGCVRFPDVDTSNFGPLGYGYHPSYTVGGYDFGPTLLYYVPSTQAWIGMSVPPALDLGTGTFTYTFDPIPVTYTP